MPSVLKLDDYFNIRNLLVSLSQTSYQPWFKVQRAFLTTAIYSLGFEITLKMFW